MQLSLRDAARLLQVAERTIVKGVEEGRLHAERVHDQYRFHRSELLEWATAQRIAVAPDLVEPRPDEALPSLSDALAAGGVAQDVPADDRATAVRAVVERLPLPPSADREFLTSVLLARESLGSTGIGDGIAIPHVRNPIVLPGGRALVALAYLSRPIEFAAPDGKPVDTLFTIVTGTVKAHLHLLSRLAFALQDAGFRRLVARRAPREELEAVARTVEAGANGGAR